MKSLTEKYILAYFDILGYKDIVLNNKIPEEKFIAIIARTVKNLIKSKEFNQNLKIETYFFSDNCVICYKKKNDVEYVDEVRLLIFVVQLIQMNLFCNFGIMIRGAILEGDLYLGKSFIYGKGIIEAYNIENNIAIYPRILVSIEVVKTLFSQIKNILYEENYNYEQKLSVSNMFNLYREWEAEILYQDGIISKEEYKSVKTEWKDIKICKDFDGYYFVDFLCVIKWGGNINEVFRKYKKQIVLGLRDNKGNKNVINKFLWCITYGNRFSKKYGYKEILHKNKIEEIIGYKTKYVDGLLMIE